MPVCQTAATTVCVRDTRTMDSGCLRAASPLHGVPLAEDEAVGLYRLPYGEQPTQLVLLTIKSLLPVSM